MLDQEPQGPNLGQLGEKRVGSARFVISQRSDGLFEVEAEPCSFIQTKHEHLVRGKKLRLGILSILLAADCFENALFGPHHPLSKII